jgi:glycosyltransferase involved in cell wall biosynthesis
MSRLHVCMLSYSFYEVDNRVMRYAETLAKRGDDVEVISLRNKDQSTFDVVRGVKVNRIQERVRDERGKLSYLFRLLKFLAKSAVFLSLRHCKNPYHLIHVHSIPEFEVFATALAKLGGAKIILDIHDLVPELFMSKFNGGGESRFFKWLVAVERASIRFSDYVIISNHIWEDRLLSRSVSQSKCTTILNYPDPSIFYPRPKTKNEDKFIVLYPGSLNWHQGLDITIKAFETIAAEIPHVEFHIYGQGGELNNLKEMVHSNGLKDRILFRSPMSIDRIAEMMSNADLGIIPKRNDGFGGEAFSTKSLEFMSLGVPLIMSETKIDRYYFNDSVVKFFKPGDVDDLARAMLEMIKNEEMRKSYSNHALKFVEEFSWSEKKQAYFNLVDRLTHGDQQFREHTSSACDEHNAGF